MERTKDSLSVFDSGDTVCVVESVDVETEMKRISHRDTETQRMDRENDKESISSPSVLGLPVFELVYLRASVPLWLV